MRTPPSASGPLFVAEGKADFRYAGLSPPRREEGGPPPAPVSSRRRPRRPAPVRQDDAREEGPVAPAEVALRRPRTAPGCGEAERTGGTLRSPRRRDGLPRRDPARSRPFPGLPVPGRRSGSHGQVLVLGSAYPLPPTTELRDARWPGDLPGADPVPPARAGRCRDRRGLGCRADRLAPPSRSGVEAVPLGDFLTRAARR